MKRIQSRLHKTRTYVYQIPVPCFDDRRLVPSVPKQDI